MTKSYFRSLTIAAAVAACIPGILNQPMAQAADAPVLAAPAQDQGLPYTRSARPRAMAKIQNQTAVFAGSRYAYVKGFKVRLDDANWRDEAVLRDGVVYVPAGFVGVLSLKDIKTDIAPTYLADRWVYTMDRPAAEMSGTVGRIYVDGRMYVALADIAKAQGLRVYQNPRGLVLIGDSRASFADGEAVLMDSVIALFDTPEKFADPDIATRYVPALARQGKWTDHVKVTPAQLALLNGPETKWKMTPESEFDFTGFNQKLLGSKVPAPGVYPRVLFSPEDVPMMAERMKSSKIGQMSLIEIESLMKKSFWDPTTSDGQVFKKLYTGDLVGLEWPDIAAGMPATSVPHQFKGQKPGIHNSHIAYVPEALTNMALFCLLTNDDVHGRQAAAAIANYFKLREPLVDEWNAVSDSEFSTSYTRPDGARADVGGNGATTQWRNIHGLVAQMNLGLALDFGGKWMTADEKETMRRVIAKATYGRRAYGQDGPVRFRDINWVAWDLPNYLALASIEGLEGFDREAYDSNRQTIRVFCEYGIDKSGVVYESNGKTPGGFQFLTLSMITLARRGENMFGHPHWRNLLTAQVQMTSPTGRAVVNSGTQYAPFSRQPLSAQFVDEIKSFYPNNLCADYLLTQVKPGADDEFARGWAIQDFTTPEAYRAKVAKMQRLRMPSPMYPGFVRSVIYDNDFTPTTRADLKLPLNFNAPTHGVFSAYSDASPDAAWINMMVRPDHYLGAGHHHSDAGMIHFSSLGVDWFTESPFSQNYAGKYHNQVIVDGKSEPEGVSGLGTGYQAAATYLGSTSNESGGFAAADLTNSYSYYWETQPPQVWTGRDKMGWEMDPSPYIKEIFAGTARYKMRPWWATYNYVNYIATSRAKFNPMQYVYRTVGLVRGEHPYGIVADDLKKDDQSRLYQWTAMLNGGVWQADVAGLAKGQAALAMRDYDPKAMGPKLLIKPAAGEPMLLVCPLGLDSGDAAVPVTQVTIEPGPDDNKGKPQPYDRIAINHKGTDVAYRVLLVPFRYGDTLPQITYNPAKATAQVQYADQVDQISFVTSADHRTSVSVTRDGKPIIAAK